MIDTLSQSAIDTYQRSGTYPVDLPCIAGMEAAGTVLAVGEDTLDVSVGDRVAYAGTIGSYAEQACVDASRLVPLPDGVDTETGAAALLQGMTAHYLSHSTYALSATDTALVHAAAGADLIVTGIALDAQAGEGRIFLNLSGGGGGQRCERTRGE